MFSPRLATISGGSKQNRSVIWDYFSGAKANLLRREIQIWWIMKQEELYLEMKRRDCFRSVNNLGFVEIFVMPKACGEKNEVKTIPAI